MGFHWACLTAILFSLASIVVQQSFGELLMLQYPTTDNPPPRKVACISEDDGAALTWNYNPIDNNRQKTSADFQPKIPKSKDISECAIWNSSKCHTHWKSSLGWEVVDSATNPMGPVFDYRWEDFEELYFDRYIENQDYLNVKKVKNSSGNVVLSVRGLTDVDIFLCDNENPAKSPCFWIIIGGWDNTRSSIRSCAKRAPPGNKKTWPNDCMRNESLTNTIDFLDEYEWRTFRIKWISDDKTIEVFRGSDAKPFLEKRVEQWSEVSHLSVRCGRGTHLRFHFYEYFLSENPNSLLYTEEFHQYDENFCVEFLVGLCPECKLNVSLVDKTGHSFINRVISEEGSSVRNEMLSWQSVRLNLTVEIIHSDDVKLKIETILEGGKIKGKWAIDNFRICKPIGQLRESTVTTSWSSPRIVCQKLSYHENVSLDSDSQNKILADAPESRELIVKLVESCGSACKSFGEKWSLCNSIGCTCSRGFKAIDCTEECADGNYGYNCHKTCGLCNTGFCDKITGFCETGCDSDTRLPPFCRTEIEESKVEKITDTTAVVRQKLEFDAVRRKVRLDAGLESSLDITIQVTAENFLKNFTLHPVETEMPSIYEVHISDLELGTTYTLQTIVSVKLPTRTISVISSSMNFDTTCYGKPKFVVTPGEDFLSVDIKDQELPSHIQRLNETAWQDQALHSFAAPKLATIEDVANEELPELVGDTPGAARCDFLESWSDQVSLVSVDGVQVEEQHLASCLPSPSTLSHFWKVIAKRKIEVILILQSSDPTNPTCCDVMPDETLLFHEPDIRVENRTTLDEEQYFTREKLRLIDTSEGTEKIQLVTVLTCKEWGRAKNKKPPQPAALVSLWTASEKIVRKEGRTLVLCHDGITGCGLYLALSFLLGRMAVESECDVISAVRAVRRVKPDFVQSLEQFDYLYDAALNYAQYFQTYANLS